MFYQFYFYLYTDNHEQYVPLYPILFPKQTHSKFKHTIEIFDCIKVHDSGLYDNLLIKIDYHLPMDL